VRVVEKFPPSLGAYLIPCSPNAPTLILPAITADLTSTQRGNGIYVVDFRVPNAFRVQVDSTR
jgi:hypothetical protein